MDPRTAAIMALAYQVYDLKRTVGKHPKISLYNAHKDPEAVFDDFITNEDYRKFYEQLYNIED